MIRIKNVLHLDNHLETFEIDSPEESEIEGQSLLALPALIDPHVHFRFPGEEEKEGWRFGARAALMSGVTTLFDMPNNQPPITTVERLCEKRRAIEKILNEEKLPLRFGLYLGATPNRLDEISKAANEAVAIKVFMGGVTGELLFDDQKALDELFRRASDAGLVVAVHAEDEATIQANLARGEKRHFRIRDRKVAEIAVLRAIELSSKWKTKLYLLHVSTKEELALIRLAKKAGLPVAAEATPHHLLFTEEDEASLGSLIKVNPPVRLKEDVEALWAALCDGTIDAIGSDHAPHTVAQRQSSNPPSGIAGIEVILPFLLDALDKKKITLPRLVELTSGNVASFFGYPKSEDWVLVDRKKEALFLDEELQTKQPLTPYSGMRFKGWPRFTIASGQLFFNPKRKWEK